MTLAWPLVFYVISIKGENLITHAIFMVTRSWRQLVGWQFGLSFKTPIAVDMCLLLYRA